MPHPVFTPQLLEDIKRLAKKKKRQDPSKTYNQWLDALSAEYGHASFNSLKQHVDQQVEDEQKLAEAQVWEARFAASLEWGGVRKNFLGAVESVRLPVFDNVPWPTCFARSSLFSCREGQRQQLDKPLFVLDDVPMHYQGEELRGDDYEILIGIIMTVGRQRCGRLVEFSADELQQAMGTSLSELECPVAHEAISRSLWRLTNCRLTVKEHNFDGPILSYADARQTPDRYAVRLNPDFANFYHSDLMLMLFSGAESQGEN